MQGASPSFVIVYQLSIEVTINENVVNLATITHWSARNRQGVSFCLASGSYILNAEHTQWPAAKKLQEDNKNKMIVPRVSLQRLMAQIIQDEKTWLHKRLISPHFLMQSLG